MKSILSAIKHIIVESLNQIWTLLGMFIAWCVLTGSARVLVGYAIIITNIIWIIFSGIQNRKGDK
jgi:hypothetical protein